MSDSLVYEHASEFVLRRVGRESILVPIHNQVGDLDSVYTLNEVASLIWSLLDGRTEIDAIAGRVCEEFDVEPAAAGADVRELLLDLQGAKLIRRVG